jgi:rhomboid protease GluP
VLTIVTLGLTAVVTLTRLGGDGVVDALRRDPDRLLDGQLWRLVTPVLVQTDRSWLVVVGTWVVCAAVGTLAEQLVTRRWWLTSYLVGALVGHGIGEVFQPHQGGTSVAYAGLLGGVAAIALRSGDRLPVQVRAWAVILAVASVVDTVVRDIHGLPYLAGLLLTMLPGLHGVLRDVADP